MAQVEPDEVAWRYERVVWLLKQKGAVEVVCCEVKSMRLMDVTPYSNALHSLCLRLGIPGCATQIGVSHLGRDGFHILPSCLTILDRTYACAIMGVPVPCPPPAEDRYRDPGLRGEWPTLGAARGGRRMGWDDRTQGATRHGRG